MGKNCIPTNWPRPFRWFAFATRICCSTSTYWRTGNTWIPDAGSSGGVWIHHEVKPPIPSEAKTFRTIPSSWNQQNIIFQISRNHLGMCHFFPDSKCKPVVVAACNAPPRIAGPLSWLLWIWRPRHYPQGRPARDRLSRYGRYGDGQSSLKLYQEPSKSASKSPKSPRSPNFDLLLSSPHFPTEQFCPKALMYAWCLAGPSCLATASAGAVSVYRDPKIQQPCRQRRTALEPWMRPGLLTHSTARSWEVPGWKWQTVKGSVLGRKCLQLKQWNWRYWCGNQAHLDLWPKNALWPSR